MFYKKQGTSFQNGAEEAEHNCTHFSARRFVSAYEWMATVIPAPLTSTKEPANTWSEIRSHRLARFSSPDSQILREIIVSH